MLNVTAVINEEIDDEDFILQINETLGMFLNRRKVQIENLNVSTVKIPFEVDTGSRLVCYLSLLLCTKRIF